jgi:AcrR family transcriptional regulator
VARKYSMRQRSTAVEQTRQRIVDATVQLHNEKGVNGTSMQDIADRADVALATVYRHFPTLDDLVPACGSRNMELNPLPTESVFAQFDTGEERVSALVVALFTHYERGFRPYEVGLAESATLPVMARLMAEVAAHIEGLVSAATKPFKPDDKHLRLAVGLCDFRVWRSLIQAGLSTEDAAQSTAQFITTTLRRTKNANRNA